LATICGSLSRTLGSPPLRHFRLGSVRRDMDGGTSTNEAPMRSERAFCASERSIPKELSLAAVPVPPGNIHGRFTRRNAAVEPVN
jgi:hypothetical protein